MLANPYTPSPIGSARITVSQDVLVTSMNDVLLMLDTKSGIYFELDEVGGRIWQLLAEHGDIQGVVRALVAEFDIGADEARADVERLVRELADNDLATIHAGAPTA